ncbi:hypothetical protein [Thiobacillus sp.]|uniref:hypothetical protein n=1 Tax=Thiobacillus sp. TaxID=924 RepID=UPI0025CD4F52|nr:hypothetical protein [Thiobacillus sp.]
MKAYRLVISRHGRLLGQFESETPWADDAIRDLLQRLPVRDGYAVRDGQLITGQNPANLRTRRAVHSGGIGAGSAFQSMNQEMKPMRTLPAILIELVGVLGAFTSHAAPAQGFELSSPDIASGSTIKQAYANGFGFGCTGQNTSPAATWRNLPAGT